MNAISLELDRVRLRCLGFWPDRCERTRWSTFAPVIGGLFDLMGNPFFRHIQTDYVLAEKMIGAVVEGDCSRRIVRPFDRV